jgi:hypothetical protein
MNINISFRAYKNIQLLPYHKLEHLLQLAEIEVENYLNVIKNYPPDRMEKCGKPYLEKLRTVVSDIKQIMEENRKD